MSSSNQADASRISIVIPSFNQGPFLATALDSILSQEPPPYEVFVADGGSSDETVDILREYERKWPQLSWLSEPDGGPAYAVNKGLEAVTGDIVGIQSSDDVYFSGAFRRVLNAFATRTEAGFLFGDVAGIDESGASLYERRFKYKSWPALFAISLCIPQGSIFFKRSLIDKVGQWDPAIYGCDLDYWLRLMLVTETIHVPEVLSGWRRYPNQRTRPDLYQRIWDDYGRMLAKSEGLALGPKNMRRWARASQHLLVLRFPPKNSYLFRWRHLCMAFFLHPTFVFFNPKMLLANQIPGFSFLQRHVKALLKA